MKRLFPLFILLLSVFSSLASPTSERAKWKFEAKKTGDNTFDIVITVNIAKGFHIYSFEPGGDGSLVFPEFTFKKNAHVKLLGKMKESGTIVHEDTKEIMGVINYFHDRVIYTQKAVVDANTTLNGSVYLSVCDDNGCLNGTEKFSIKFEGLAVTASDTLADTTTAAVNTAAAEVKDTSSGNTASAAQVAPASNTETPAGGASEHDLAQKSLLEIFLTGFVAGLVAFIMPCIYAMLPITVSFFTKRSKNRATGLRNAVIYSLSIISIFTAIGALISVSFSEKTMYEISTSLGFNLFVFITFVIFGISFLGAFEITLPASWSNRIDSKANSNSFLGIFFMALVLVIVSFSCTSAFISSLIVYIVKSQNSLGGLIGFFGFGFAIALPFAFFAFFPGLLNNIAKSGGWLNSVKVTMGFVELAMAMKFLSNVDLEYHWHLLDFEVYLSIWIILFGILGLYLLGKVKLSHDDDLPKNTFGQPYLTVTRLIAGMATLAFTIYMIPGLWGAPLTGISGWLPERKTLEFNLHDNIATIQSNTALKTEDNGVAPRKYTSTLKSELPGITAYFDYDEALAASRKLKKPLLLDFTGHSCINCRKMERAVLSKPEVLRELREHFVVASLYCDDKTPLPENERYISKHDGSEITNLGGKNLDIEVSRFHEVGQPIYIFVDSDGKLIKHAGGYNPDVQRFLKIIDDVKAEYGKR